MGKHGKFPFKQMMNEERDFGKRMKNLIQNIMIEL